MISTKISEAEGKLGNINAYCPYCNFYLQKFPERKTKCKSCANYIYSRKRPFDQKKVLLTQTDADKVEYQWAVENDSEIFPTIQGYLEEKEAERLAAEKLRTKHDREPSPKEVKNLAVRSLVDKDRLNSLNFYKESGITEVQILSAYDACDACLNENKKIYPIDKMSAVPVPHCRNKHCRCAYVSV